jgi:hypothetical protein
MSSIAMPATAAQATPFQIRSWLSCEALSCGLAVEDDVEVSGRLRFACARWETADTEDTFRPRPHRIRAVKRQRCPGEKSTDRIHVDLMLAHHARLADVSLDPPGWVEQVNLDSGVDGHQHAQQFAARARIILSAGAQHRPVFDDVSREPVRQPL